MRYIPLCYSAVASPPTWILGEQILPGTTRPIILVSELEEICRTLNHHQLPVLTERKNKMYDIIKYDTVTECYEFLSNIANEKEDFKLKFDEDILITGVRIYSENPFNNNARVTITLCGRVEKTLCDSAFTPMQGKENIDERQYNKIITLEEPFFIVHGTLFKLKCSIVNVHVVIKYKRFLRV